MAAYDAPFITKLLRAMPVPRLAVVTATNFQTWPCDVVLPAKVIGELISNERARRRK